MSVILGLDRPRTDTPNGRLPGPRLRHAWVVQIGCGFSDNIIGGWADGAQLLRTGPASGRQTMESASMTSAAKGLAGVSTPGTPTEQTRRLPAWVVAWFALLMVGTLAVRLADPTGWLGSDDAAYHSAAEHLLAGETIHRVHHHNARMAVIAPITLTVAVFGDNPTAVILPTLIASMLCLVAVVILGRLVWGWWEGLGAATLVGVLPCFHTLSTAAYPDIHACLWSTGAVLLGLGAVRVQRLPWVWILGVGSGLALGLATSAKVFAVTAGIAVLVGLCGARGESYRRRFAAGAAIILGGFVAFLTDGLFYLWVADDFFFKHHALSAAKSTDDLFQVTGVPTAAAYAAVAGERLTMLFRPAASGWGKVAILFWPAAGLALLKSRGRSIALWAIGAYVLIALIPVRLKNGPQPYPFFDGRAVLTTCVPFALCLAWTIRQAAQRAFRPAWVRPGSFAAIVVMAIVTCTDWSSLNGFRSRATSRVGLAIRQVIVATEWNDDTNIFLSPSLYLRHRILFPAKLRDRLRVAVDNEAPQWWRDAVVDIGARAKALPPPNDAYLLATPTQAKGELEWWDYGVGLPRDALEDWRGISPRVQVARFKDKTIGLTGPGHRDSGEPVLWLLGNVPARDALDAVAQTTRGSS